jgi:hypothetical protein
MPAPSRDTEYAREYLENLEKIKAGKTMLNSKVSSSDHDNDRDEGEASQQTQHTKNIEQNAPESDANHVLEHQPEVAENTNIAHSLYVRLKITAAMKARLCQLTSVRKKKVTVNGLEDGAEKPNEIQEPVMVNPLVEVNANVPAHNSAGDDGVVKPNEPINADQPGQGHNNCAEKQDDNSSAILVGNDDDNDLFGDRQLDREEDQRKGFIPPPLYLGLLTLFCLRCTNSEATADN